MQVRLLIPCARGWIMRQMSYIQDSLLVIPHLQTAGVDEFVVGSVFLRSVT